MKTVKPKCTLCKKEINGYGNNAEPIKQGRCCDLCNDLYVIPARIMKLQYESNIATPPNRGK
tara:strand:- start:362 stop:547 length:186 start_codon:yes stop_codon:yes gene_type:complete